MTLIIIFSAALFIGIALNIIIVIVAIIKQKNVFGKLKWRQKIRVWLENNYCSSCGTINGPVNYQDETEDIPSNVSGDERRYYHQQKSIYKYCGICGKLLEIYIYK